MTSYLSAGESKLEGGQIPTDSKAEERPQQVCFPTFEFSRTLQTQTKKN